ncbi:MAG: cupin domain-containing protein [Blastocatellia bacterium]|nr:cupin domain-containing protein [Blastocatellia bacterium]
MVIQEIREGALVTDWTRIPVQQIAEGIRRQMFVGENVMVCRFTFDPFVVTDVHSHPHEQVTMVISGKVRFKIDGLTVIAAPGDVLHFPSNNQHGATMLDEEVVLIDIFSPIREEFLGAPADVQPMVSCNGKYGKV